MLTTIMVMIIVIIMAHNQANSRADPALPALSAHQPDDARLLAAAQRAHEVGEIVVGARPDPDVKRHNLHRSEPMIACAATGCFGHCWMCELPPYFAAGLGSFRSRLAD